MITEQQREERRMGIGGSDLPIILGLSNYMTPYQLYLEKIGEGEEKETTEGQYWGNKLEAIVREEFEIRNNVVVEERETVVHPLYNYLRGNVDGYIPAWNAVLEVKCSSSFMAHEWGEDESDVIPMQYLVQVAHYCAVMNADSAHIAVLIGGNQYRQYKYTRDMELEIKLIDAAKSFWDCVVNRTPPDATKIIDLKTKYPTSKPEKSIKINSEISEELTTLANNRLKIKELSDIEEKAKFNIMQYMEDAEALCGYDDKQLITWKTNKKGSRTFLVKGI